MNPIYLREYESTDSLPIPREEVLNIRKRLQSSKGGSQLAEVIYDLDGVKLRALAQVGYIPVRDDLQLVVMPKIKNFDDFFYVIERARLIPSFFLDESIFAALGESERNRPLDFLIRALLHKLRLIRRDGFYRRSVLRSEQHSSVKGKIEITQTIRNSLAKGYQHQLQISYFDATEDIIENRFIKYTIWLLLHLKPLSTELINEAKVFWRMFASIPFHHGEQYLYEIERTVRKRLLPSSRSYYLEILSLCFLIVNNTTVVVKNGEDVRLCAFVIDMNSTFEYYIRNLITEALYPDFKVLNGNESANKQPLFQNTNNPKITPDIIIYENAHQRFVLVGDTKYKRKAKPSDDDWYQIISYTAALDIPIGVLIYPTEEPKVPEEYHINGRVIWVYYYPLESPKAQERDLVDFLFHQAGKALASLDH